MARIFNIYFTHEHADYSAVVSVRPTPFFTEYTLLNIDDNLLNMLPGNKIVSREHDQFKFRDAGKDASSPLMDAIIKAVAEHMHATEA